MPKQRIFHLDQLGYMSPSTERLPAIVLTRRGDLQTKLAAFDHGVDDILTVPFSPEELVARMLVVMRRTYHELVRFTPVERSCHDPLLDYAVSTLPI